MEFWMKAMLAVVAVAVIVVAAGSVVTLGTDGDEAEEETDEVSYLVEIFDMRESTKYGEAEEGRMWVYMQVRVYSGTPSEYPAVAITYIDGTVVEYEPCKVVTEDKDSYVRYCLYYDIEAVTYAGGIEMPVSIAQDRMEAVYPDTWTPYSS